MLRLPETPTVVDQVARTAELSRAWARKLIDVFHDIVDEAVKDDEAVVAPPLIVAYDDNPVLDRFADRLADLPEDQVDAILAMDLDAAAAALDLDLDEVIDHRIVGFHPLLTRALARLGVDHRRDSAAAAEVERALGAWLDTFEDGRRYRISRLAVEAAAEEWLVGHLDALRAVGYPVSLERRQWVFVGMRPDLVCRFTEDTEADRAGDWLVIELKRDSAAVEDVAQLAGYVTYLEQNVAQSGERVAGLLVTDGASPGVRAALDEAGFGYATWTRLGYRTHSGGGVDQVPGYRIDLGAEGALLVDALELTEPIDAVYPLSAGSVPAAKRAKEAGTESASTLDVLGVLGLGWDALSLDMRPVDAALAEQIDGPWIPLPEGGSHDTAGKAAGSQPLRVYTLHVADVPVVVFEAPFVDRAPSRVWQVGDAGQWVEYVDDLRSAIPQAPCTLIAAKVTGSYQAPELLSGDPVTGTRPLTDVDFCDPGVEARSMRSGAPARGGPPPAPQG